MHTKYTSETHTKKITVLPQCYTARTTTTCKEQPQDHINSVQVSAKVDVRERTGKKHRKRHEKNHGGQRATEHWGGFWDQKFWLENTNSPHKGANTRVCQATVVDLQQKATLVCLPDHWQQDDLIFGVGFGRHTMRTIGMLVEEQKPHLYGQTAV
jgi:hypothetical protein